MKRGAVATLATANDEAMTAAEAPVLEFHVAASYGLELRVVLASYFSGFLRYGAGNRRDSRSATASLSEERSAHGVRLGMNSRPERRGFARALGYIKQITRIGWLRRWVDRCGR